jgi:hypothetical protein
MKSIILSLLATILLMGSGFGVYAYSKAADTPVCCQNRESCCPGSACCSGSNHAQCPRMQHRA